MVPAGETQNPVGFTPRVGSIPTSGTMPTSARSAILTLFHPGLRALAPAWA